MSKIKGCSFHGWTTQSYNRGFLYYLILNQYYGLLEYQESVIFVKFKISTNDLNIICLLFIG